MTAHNEEYGISNALGEYLSAVYELSESKPSVRITDVALYMNISKPSVNRAMNSLKNSVTFHTSHTATYISQTRDWLWVKNFQKRKKL